MPNTSDAAEGLQPPPPTILLVEDEPTVREVTREALEMGGYRVLEASGPDEAVHIAGDRTAQIDLLLADVVMPGMSGPELARLVCESRPELLTIFMTGYSEHDIPRTAAHGVLHGHIQKPFTVEGLLSRVADALAAGWHEPANQRSPQFPSS
jgi:two-component system cell cycle sensor histidine kinase/response regulator CckA